MCVTIVLVQRRNTAGKVYYQARFKDELGNVIKSISYKDAKTRYQAYQQAEKDKDDIFLSDQDDPYALQYCREFWSENSPYFKSRRLKGKPLSESYRNTGVFGLKHFEPFLANKKMSEVTARGLELFSEKLAEKGVNARSINHGLSSVKRPFAVHSKNTGVVNRISTVENHAEFPKKRGVLSVAEIARVCEYSEDYRAKAIFLLGALCGLRKGEVRGLMIDDVDFDRGIINICHNFIFSKEGIKEPKYNSIRSVPAAEIVLETLRKVIELYPVGQFVIPNYADPQRPCDDISIIRAFTRILSAIGITPNERKKRNLVFHGLRHTFVTLSQSIGLQDFVVARLSGHKSLEMVQRYTNADGYIDFDSAKKKMGEMLKSIV